MAFAPHFGMFSASAGEDLVDQLRFASDQGFYAWEDNPMKDRNVADQKRVADELERLGMRMGVISALRGVWKEPGCRPEPSDLCDAPRHAGSR